MPVKYSNELKVGLTIILTTVIFILGVRYFEDLPLFGSTYNLQTEFSNAAGLIAGNVVRVNGVTVGSVDEVAINPESNRVRVLFHVDGDVMVREGSTTKVSGLDALGVVRMDLLLGPPDGERIEQNGFVPAKEGADLMGDLAAQAPDLMAGVGDVLTGLNEVLAESKVLIGDPDSDMRRTLVSMRHAMNTVDALLRTERDRVASILGNVDGMTAGLDTLFSEHGDSLGVMIDQMNQTLAQLDSTLTGVDQTTAALSQMLEKINSGEGTIGRLMNDPGLYERTDSLLIAMNRLMTDFQADPGRYLKEMRIVDLF